MSRPMISLTSLRRQNLLAEFAALKQACPEDVFVTLTPGDLSLWSGVIFVRKGPYAPAILHFQISFPDTYPELPPLVTFSTDIFHPLVSPLTTYTYTTDIQDNGTVSASDNERLPPGGFSLRHGFPTWFDRVTRNKRASLQNQQQLSSSAAAALARLQTPPPVVAEGAPAEGTVEETAKGTAETAERTPSQTPPPELQVPLRSTVTVAVTGRNSESVQNSPVKPPPPSSSAAAAADATTSRLPPPKPSFMETHPSSSPSNDISTYDVLRYIRSTFDDEDVLDAVPIEAAGNPGAWHAWRSHQRQQGKTLPADVGKDGTSSSRWNWEHVWEERVKKGIDASISDAVLYGSAGAADDAIRFLKLEDDEIESVKENLKRTMETAI